MWPRTSVTQTSSPGPPGSAAHPGKTQAQQKHKQRGAREAGRKDTGVPAGREFQRARRLAKAPQLPQGGKAALRVDRFSYLLPLGCARLCSHLPTIPKCCRSVSSGLLPGGPLPRAECLTLAPNSLQRKFNVIFFMSLHNHSFKN